MEFNFFIPLAALSVVPALGNETYIVNVTNSGPACIDSELTFFAHLNSSSGEMNSSEQFCYIWNSSGKSIYLRGGLRINLTKLFTQYEVWNYTQCIMHVKVLSTSKKMENVCFPPYNSKRIIARGKTIFNLTDMFRIHLHFHQNFNRKKDFPEDTFITGIPINISAEIVDRFVRPTFNFHWIVNRQTISTNETSLELVFNSTTDSYIELSAVAMVTTCDVNNENHFVQRNSSRVFKKLQLKDLISDVRITAEDTACVGVKFYAHVNCRGSAPFIISWNITRTVNDSEVYEGKASTSSSSSHICSYNISYVFSALGSYLLTVTVENPVDIQTTEYRIDVIPTTSVPPIKAHTSVAVPFFCVIIALLAVTVIVWAHFRIPRRSQVEAASFDFYSPTTSVQFSAKSSALTRLQHKLKEYFRSFAQNLPHHRENDGSIELHFFATKYGTIETRPEQTRQTAAL